MLEFPVAARLLGIDAVDWCVLGGYFLLILVIGLWSARKVKDMTDFFMGGRRFGKVFMMFFAFGSGTSSEQAISVVAGTWRGGLAGIWWQFLWLPATPFYWVIAPVMRRMRALTTADFFESRFNRGTALLYSIYGIVISIVFIAAALFSSGKMIDALTGNELERVGEELNLQVPKIDWRPGPAAAAVVPDDATATLGDGAGNAGDGAAVDDDGPLFAVGWRAVKGFEFAILVITVLFVVYGMAGGLGAAIITDFIQGILTIAFSFLLLPFVFMRVGGFGALHAAGESRKGMFDYFISPEVAAVLEKEPITVFYVVMLSLTALAGIVIQPHIMGVCGAGKTEMEGRVGFTFGNFLKRFCTVAWTFTGLACITWYLSATGPLATSDKPEDQDLYAQLQLRGSQEEYASLAPEEQKQIDRIDRDFADKLFGRAAYDILPTIAPGLIGLLMASLLAAVMSTCDAQMVVASGLFTENIYKRYMRRSASPKHYLWVGRLAALIIVLLAVLLQTTFTDVIDALKVVIKTPAAIGISLWIAIVWRRWNTPAVWTSTIFASVMWAFIANYPQEPLREMMSAGRLPDWMFATKGDTVVMREAWKMLLILSSGVLSGAIVALITPIQSEEKLDSFFQLLRTPVIEGEHVETPCTLPVNAGPQERVIRIGQFQFPWPTLLGTGGFILAWLLVVGIVWGTGWLAGRV